jgi:hypothetical protein
VPAAERAASGSACARCGVELGAAFRFAADAPGRVRCRRCALLDAPMLRRSAVIALVVGTILVAINQGDVLLSGQSDPMLLWKIPLTYLVPFVVATAGALLNSRVR